jgi:hypothetical protein
MTWETEVLHQVWNNESGDRFEVGPDRDGLDLIEIRSYTDKGECDARMTMPSEVATKIAQAILKEPSDKIVTLAKEIIDKDGDSAGLSHIDILRENLTGGYGYTIDLIESLCREVLKES